MFGDFMKKKRLEKKLSLREFCILLNEDASNWSKIERGKLAPPKDVKRLGKIAHILGIKKNSEDWENLIDYADTAAGRIPKYIMSDKEVFKSLPIFFRTIGSVKPSPEELRQLIKKIRNG